MDDYLVGWPDANNFAPLLFTFQSVSLLKSAVILFIDLKSVFPTLTSVWNCTVHCGNIMIFLSLRFYVKSILGIIEVQNLPF